MKSLRLDASAEEWVKVVGTGSEFATFFDDCEGEETRVYVGTSAGVSMLKNI
jgi:hypothetical protein